MLVYFPHQRSFHWGFLRRWFTLDRFETLNIESQSFLVSCWITYSWCFTWTVESFYFYCWILFELVKPSKRQQLKNQAVALKYSDLFREDLWMTVVRVENQWSVDFYRSKVKIKPNLGFRVVTWIFYISLRKTSTTDSPNKHVGPAGCDKVYSDHSRGERTHLVSWVDFTAAAYYWFNLFVVVWQLYSSPLFVEHLSGLFRAQQRSPNTVRHCCCCCQVHAHFFPDTNTKM